MKNWLKGGAIGILIGIIFSIIVIIIGRFITPLVIIFKVLAYPIQTIINYLFSSRLGGSGSLGLIPIIMPLIIIFYLAYFFIIGAIIGLLIDFSGGKKKR